MPLERDWHGPIQSVNSRTPPDIFTTQWERATDPACTQSRRMSYRSGKQKSGNVVLLAGYTHGAIGSDRSGADRKLVTRRDCGRFAEQYPATHADPMRYRVNKRVHNIDRLSKASFLVLSHSCHSRPFRRMRPSPLRSHTAQPEGPPRSRLASRFPQSVLA
jgi:hypothetical protein